MTLTYVCDGDTHIKESFHYRDLAAVCVRDASGAHALAVAFSSRANSKLCVLQSKGQGCALVQETLFRRTFRFRDIGVQSYPLISGDFANVRYILAASTGSAR